MNAQLKKNSLLRKRLQKPTNEAAWFEMAISKPLNVSTKRENNVNVRYGSSGEMA